MKSSPPSPAVLTQALGQRPIPGAVPLAGDGAGAKQVIAGVTAVRNARLEAVTMWPAGQYLPDTVIDMTRLCAVHNWRKMVQEEREGDERDRDKEGSIQLIL